MDFSVIVLVVVVTALAFDFTNGFHDTANAMATSIATGALRPKVAVGKGITDIESPQGFSAETSAAAVIMTSSQLGFALSTTHVCSGGVIGAGVGKRLAEVRWGVAGRMAVAWLLTLPAAAVVGALAGELASQGTVGTVVVALSAVAVAAGCYLASRRDPVGAHNVNDVPTHATA
jgi:PiT family inorganic phosphate transporter